MIIFFFKSDSFHLYEGGALLEKHLQWQPRVHAEFKVRRMILHYLGICSSPLQLYPVLYSSVCRDTALDYIDLNCKKKKNSSD